ncbi:hydrogenase small subunit [Methanocella conradii]|uniref:hydrogenase small subunit n=1 Tax=Methanocella conradii TaxID=1175444 RepID=UPI00157BD9BA|nr:hydrogenase small subunit [Methanocella conradii]
MDDLKNGPKMTRRAFLAAAAAVGAAAFLYSNAPGVAAAIEKSGKRLLWLRGSGCGGCTASILSGGNPEVLTALNKIKLELAYHDGLMGQQGVFVDGSPAGDSGHNSNIRLDELVHEGGYVLVVEGAIPNGPEGSGRYCMSGATPFKQIFINAAPGASCIIALGTCASYGGISRSLKVADATGVSFSGTSRMEGAMARYGLNNNVINVPGCPPNPDWLLLTLADVLSGADVEVDAYGRPKAFFGSAVHESCPRRGAFDRALRDDGFSEGNCLYNLGCKGTLAFADCPTRRWNDGASMCTQSGGPCVACVEPSFPDAFMPFFSKVESRGILGDVDVDTGAKIIIGAAVIGAGIHAVKRLAIGESGREDEKGGKR